MNNTSARFACIKSVPVSELTVTSIVYLTRAEDATGQDHDGRPYTVAESETLDAALEARAHFEPFSGRCDCCGSTRLQYACNVVHVPTLQGYYVGRDCADKLLGFADGHFAGLSVALAEKAASRRRLNWWLTANPQHAAIVEWAGTASHHIASDVYRKLKAYGSISEAQVALLHRIKAQTEQRAAKAASEPQPTGPAPEGRLEVEVEYLGTKATEGFRGSTVVKALVRLAGYNTKAWVTACGLQRGDRALIRANFTRSDRDPHFAFGRRPKVIKYLTTES
jgi:hypothetical protein